MLMEKEGEVVAEVVEENEEVVVVGGRMKL